MAFYSPEEIYARRRYRAAQIAELRKLAEEIRIKQAEMHPIRERLAEMRRERMRQDGPRGFVMKGKNL